MSPLMASRATTWLVLISLCLLARLWGGEKCQVMGEECGEGEAKVEVDVLARWVGG